MKPNFINPLSYHTTKEQHTFVSAKMGKKRSRKADQEAEAEGPAFETYEDGIESDEEALVAEIRQNREAESSTEAPARLTINDTEGLLERLEDVKNNLGFIETLQTASTTLSEEVDANDDLTREVAFYRQALEGVKKARTQLDKLGVNHRRPVDYFAEMVKSDEHMARIKQRLLFEKQKMDAFEQRKKSQDYKRFAKQVQAEKLKEKSKNKKQAIEDAKNLKGIVDNNDELVSSRKRKRDDQSNGRNKKRDAKNQKFGYGGKKRGTKRNDSSSARDMSDFSGKRNKATFPGMKKGGGKNRPGKAARAQARAGRSRK